MELLMEAIMDKIENEIIRLYWNRYQKITQSPFQNTGAEYSNETFTVRAYNWNGNDLPNFEYKDLTKKTKKSPTSKQSVGGEMNCVR